MSPGSTLPVRPFVTETKNERRFEVSVEGLRGVAALLVACSHIFAVPVLDPQWQPPSPVRFLEAGHAAVLIFFMLSGYVIGLTNSDAFNRERAKNYLWRRATRLLPVYVLAWGFTIAIGGGLGVMASLGNLAFLQNFDPYFHLHIPPLLMNQPSWSLNYEVVYYLCFLLLWSVRPPLWTHLAGAGLISLAGWVIPNFPVFVSGYAVGWIFWSLGWWVSTRPAASNGLAGSWPVLSGVLLLVATYHFACGQIFLGGLGLRSPSPPGMVNLSNLAMLPACALCLIGSADRVVPGRRLIQITAFAIPVATTALLLALGRLEENPRWLAAAGFTLGACLVAPVFRRDWLNALAPFGSISYGFYLIHFPLLFVVQRLPLPGGTALTFSCRAVIWLALSIGGAWLLEKQVQPWIKGLLAHRRSLVA